MITHRLLAAPLAAILFTTPALAAGVTAIGGTVQAGSFARIADIEDRDSSTQSLPGVPAPLIANAFSSATDGTITVQAASSVAALWTSANAGSVLMAWGWATQNGVGDTPIEFSTRTPNNQNWVYNFSTGAAPVRFSARWTLDIMGDNSFGIQGVYGAGGLPFDITPFTFDPVDDTGAFTVTLAANTDHSVSIYNFGNLGSRAFANPNASAQFQMDWQITAIPEPATWTLLIAGFGLVGFAARRQRSHPAPSPRM